MASLSSVFMRPVPSPTTTKPPTGSATKFGRFFSVSLRTYDYLGVQFEIYHPGEVTMPGSKHSAENVYVINYEQCVLADLVVFNVTQPSLGVGCESQIASDATVPVWFLPRWVAK